MKDYPQHYEQLKVLIGRLGEEIPKTMSGFGALHKGATQPGAVDTKTKELIALGIAVAVRCDGCIAFHVHDAIEAGATRAEILEAVGVAVLMGGGPALMYGAEALSALDQFQPETA
jgi:AhpD family alkylhydroperoxidase